MNKRTIEGLLSWAFAEELCKVGGAAEAGHGYAVASSGIADYADYGTIIDRSPNAYGVIPNFVFEGEPHPSAMLVGDAVRALAALDGFEVGDGWNPFPGWSDPQGLIRTEVDRTLTDLGLRSGRINGRHVVSLVINCAILKRGPVWQAQEPRTMEVTGDNGKALWFVLRSAKDRTGKVYSYEDNGYDFRKHRPMKGAFRKWRLEHPVRSAIIGRLDWQLWQSALETLHKALSLRPEFTGMTAFHPDRHPWKRSERVAKNNLSA